jgi:hypothetical protein
MRPILCALLVLAGCGKTAAGDDQTGEVLAAWRKLGETPGTFEAVADRKNCRAGRVGGLEATLCIYPDVAEARRAEGVAVGAIKDATGLALAEGKMLLVLADPARQDPSGKKMNALARTFRNR